MANLVLDSLGKPAPQYLSRDGAAFEYAKGKDGAMDMNIKGLDPKDPGAVPTKVLPVQLIDSAGNIIPYDAAKGLLVQVGDVDGEVKNLFYNGSSWEPAMINQNTIILPSAERTGVINTPDIKTYNASELFIALLPTAGTGVISTVTVEGKFGNVYIPVFTFTDLNITSLNALLRAGKTTIGADTSGRLKQGVLPAVFRLSITGNTTALTYSVVINLMP